MVVVDNLGEGVLTSDIYDPAINPLYPNVLKHHHALALPCRVADPEIGAELRPIREAYTRIAREV